MVSRYGFMSRIPTPLQRKTVQETSLSGSRLRAPSKWVHLGSNQGPSGYEPDALTAELWTRGRALSGRFASISPGPLQSLFARRQLVGHETAPGLLQAPRQLPGPPRVIHRMAPL